MLRASKRLAAVGVALALSGCSDEPTRITGSFVLRASPTAVEIDYNGVATITLTVARAGGFSGEVAIAIDGLPAGVAASVAPRNVAGDTAIVTLAAADSAPPGQTNVMITGSAPGLQSHSVSVPLTTKQKPAIALVFSDSSFAILQGDSVSFDVEVRRTNFAGTVALGLRGYVPVGVDLRFDPELLTNGATKSRATLVAHRTTRALEYPGMWIRAAGSGVPEAELAFSVDVRQRGSYSFRVDPDTVVVFQQSVASSVLQVTRLGGFGAPVELHVLSSNLPGGTEAYAVPAETLGDSSRLMIHVKPDAAPGLYHVVVFARPAPPPEPTDTIYVRVASKGSTVPISLDFCPGEHPTWAATQDSLGGWTRASVDANGTVTASVTRLFGLAYVQTRESGFGVVVSWQTLEDVQRSLYVPCVPEARPNTVQGTVTGLAPGQMAVVHMGSARDTVTAAQPGFTLAGLPARTLDLFAWRASAAAPRSPPDKLIIRRNVGATNGATLTPLDFAGAESVTPAAASLMVFGTLGGDPHIVESTFQSATGTVAAMPALPLAVDRTTYATVPTPARFGSDFYTVALTVDATDSLHGRSALSYRGSTYGQPTADSVALRDIAVPVVSLLTVSGSPRYRVQMASETTDRVTFTFSQDARTYLLRLSGRYLLYSSSSPDIDVRMPDLSAIEGWQETWGLAGGPARLLSVAESSPWSPNWTRQRAWRITTVP